MHIHQIDLHYHAGQEREPGATLNGYLDHALVTGRRVLGLTDHYGLYLGPARPGHTYAYDPSPEGLRAYHADIVALRPRYPDLTLLFAPEIGPRTPLTEIPDEVIALSDLFIVEAAYPATGIEENTAALIDRIEEVAGFVARVGVPAFVAHPFRSAVNHRLVKRDIEPWVTALEPRPGGDWAPEELAQFFVLDVARVGAACRQHGVFLEINGNTHYRVRASNLPVALQMLWAAYRLLQREGAEFAPGSDQHGFTSSVGRTGGYVPYDAFEMLGLTAEDLRIAKELGLAVPEGESIVD